MNTERYKQRLLEMEQTLSGRIGREADQGRGEFIDSAHDAGDASVADEVSSEQFTEAEHDANVLQQVRDALRRIADGTFGTCIVDGGPIEEQRLEARAVDAILSETRDASRGRDVGENADLVARPSSIPHSLQTGSDHDACRRLDRPSGSADLSRASGDGRRVQSPLTSAPYSPPSERPRRTARAPRRCAAFL